MCTCAGGFIPVCEPGGGRGWGFCADCATGDRLREALRGLAAAQEEWTSQPREVPPPHPDRPIFDIDIEIEMVTQRGATPGAARVLTGGTTGTQATLDRALSSVGEALSHALKGAR